MTTVIACLATHVALASDVSCPRTTEFYGKNITLSEAHLMHRNGYLGIDFPSIQLGSKRFRETDTIPFDEYKNSAPVYITCKYGGLYAKEQVIVPVPDDVATCVREGYDTKHSMVITALYCKRGAGHSDDIPHFKTELITDKTELAGFHLRMTEDAIDTVIKQFGYGLVSTSLQGEKTMIIRQADTTNKIRLIFSDLTKSLREISILVPNEYSQKYLDDTYFSIIKKYGEPGGGTGYLGDNHFTDRWPLGIGEKPEFQVELWTVGKSYPFIIEHRLVDMTDPQSRQDRVPHK
jgi:hypothetical protein